MHDYVQHPKLYVRNTDLDQGLGFLLKFEKIIKLYKMIIKLFNRMN